jgi:UDPglucose 6-dehydrogenase
VGTCEQLAERLRRRAPQLAFSVAYHPENLRLGEALRTFLEPDFLLVGAEEEAVADRLLELYSGVSAPRLKMSTRSAELAKHALNAFLGTSISFVNELAGLAEACGADVRDVARALRHDRRIGPHAFLNPGPGFSGGTLGRDIQTLRRLGEQVGRKTLLLDATLEVNNERLPHLVETVRSACGGLRGMRVGLLGLTYKPGTNTLRRSHAVALARSLLQAGAEVRAYDPRMTEPCPETRGLVLCRDAYQTAEAADALLVITPWPEFKNLDWGRLRQAMRQPVLIDAHNCLDDRAARQAGWRYRGTGIPESSETRAQAGVGS